MIRNPEMSFVNPPNFGSLKFRDRLREAFWDWFRESFRDPLQELFREP